MPERITSRKNDLIQRYLALACSARKRREEHCFTAEGARLCADAAASGVAVQALFFTEEADEKYAGYLQTIRRSCRSESFIPASLAACISGTKHPQGIFCICSMPEKTDGFPALTDGSRLVLLENMQDPANLGAVLRTAEALGIQAVLLGGGCCDPYSPKVLRASMGAVFRLPLFFCPNVPDTVVHLNALGCRTFAAVPDADAVPVTSIRFSGPSAAVIGNEGNGLTAETEHACSQRATVPMRGRAESLNAAASAAILMWEMVRGSDGFK